MSSKSAKKTKPTRKFRRSWLVALVIIIAIPAFLSIIYASYTLAYRSKIYPNTYVGNVNFGKKTPAEAEELLKQSIQSLPKELEITLDGQAKPSIKRDDLSATYNTKDTVDSLYSVGRNASFAQSVAEITKSIISRNHRLAKVAFDNQKAADALGKTTSALSNPAKDASVTLNKDGSLTVTPEKEGNGITTQELSESITTSLGKLSNKVALSSKPLKPKLTQNQLTPVLDEVKSILQKAPLTLKVEDKKIEADSKTVFSWLAFSTVVEPSEKPLPSPISFYPFVQTASANQQDATATVTFDEEAIKVYVANFANTANKPAQNAELGVINGEVKIVKAHTNGTKIKVEDSVKEIIKALSSTETTQPATITLATETDEAKIQESTLTSLGIKEVIGHGETNFKGSPPNRVHNLKTGTGFLNGELIAPGAEFSTVKTLGAVDGSTGYLPELVIKDNKTTPEFGGGLCQVSTTLFRSVMNAGLKVTERHNHSYRVSYYEPPIGLDATIYLPAPDFRFLNDTPGYILVQGRVEGTRIIFDLYGTKDGRSSTISEPIVTNITDPPPPMYVDTDTLPKGEVKQIEKAHQGATAVVTYTVTREGKELFKQTFRSKYKAWQARYLVGTKEG